MVLYGIVWYGMVIVWSGHGRACFCMVWYGRGDAMVLYGMVCGGMVMYGKIMVW